MNSFLYLQIFKFLFLKISKNLKNKGLNFSTHSKNFTTHSKNFTAHFTFQHIF
jgi:hypothetical protein